MEKYKLKNMKNRLKMIWSILTYKKVVLVSKKRESEKLCHMNFAGCNLLEAFNMLELNYNNA